MVKKIARLSGWDAIWLYIETSRMSANASSMFTVHARGIDDELPESYVARELSKRMHLLPELRQKIYSPWYNIDRPFWKEDPDFNVRNHVVGIQLPFYKYESELLNLVAKLHGTRLPRHLPLWRLYVIYGKDFRREDEITLVWKANHAGIDPASTKNLTEVCFSTSIEPSPRYLQIDQKDQVTDKWVEIVGDGLRRKIRRARALPALIAKSRRSAGRAKVDLESNTMLRPPKTFMNRTASGHMEVATGRLSITKIKQISAAHDAKLHDFLLCVLGGALKATFDERREKFETSLVASAAMAMSDQDSRDSYVTAGSTSISVWRVPVYNHIYDPHERLDTIVRYTSKLKESRRASGENLIRSWAEYIVGPLLWLQIELIEKSKLADRIQPAANLVVSSVSLQVGKNDPYLGLPLKSLYTLGPLMQTTGINVTATGLGDTLGFSVVTDRRYGVSASRFVGNMIREFVTLERPSLPA